MHFYLISFFIADKNVSLRTVRESSLNNAILVLRFKYDKREILANYNSVCFVDLIKVKEELSFEKRYRDFEYESIAHRLLKDLGYTT